MKKTLAILGLITAAVSLGFAGLAGWFLYPHENMQPLPQPLIALDSAEGIARLDRAEYRVDFRKLSASFQAQRLASYCGVASGVSVLEALGSGTTQRDFFTDEASRIRSRFRVMFGGMSLRDLAGLLDAHGLRTSVHYADLFSVEDFRSTVERNLANGDDYLIVNYQREALGQGRVGHMSPLAAYDRGSDSILIMDTARHKYPPTWVPIRLLYAGMSTHDEASGLMRGYIETSR